MLGPLLLLTLAWTGQQAAEEEKGPDEYDLQVAQVALIHGAMGSEGMVHCNRFRNYQAKATSDPAVFEVRYEEYRSPGPWKRLKATLRRGGDQWVWVRGDYPKCSIMIIETEEK